MGGSTSVQEGTNGGKAQMVMNLGHRQGLGVREVQDQGMFLSLSPSLSLCFSSLASPSSFPPLSNPFSICY